MSDGSQHVEAAALAMKNHLVNRPMEPSDRWSHLTDGAISHLTDSENQSVGGIKILPKPEALEGFLLYASSGKMDFGESGLAPKDNGHV